MAVIPVPSSIGFENCELTLMRATQEGRSPFTGKRQVVTSPFALWYFTGTVVPLQGRDAGKVRSFVSKLKGRANTFRLPVPAAERPMSGYVGSPGAVDGAGQMGQVLATKNWTPSTLILCEGDYFNLGDELKIASQDIMSDPSGKAVLYFEPDLRVAAPNNAPIQLNDPYLYLAAQEDDIAKWGLKDYNTHTVKVSAIEAFE